jgi:hypothetical protein
MASGEGQIGRVGVEIMAAVRAVMLRIDEVDIAGTPGLQVAQETFGAPQSIGSSAATRASAPFIVAAADDDFGLGQVFDTSDALCHVGKVFTRSGHGNILQVMLCSPGYIAKFPLSTPEKLCIVATVSEITGIFSLFF